jgi:hypothetical protein
VTGVDITDAGVKHFQATYEAGIHRPGWRAKPGVAEISAHQRFHPFPFFATFVWKSAPHHFASSSFYKIPPKSCFSKSQTFSYVAKARWLHEEVLAPLPLIA